MSDEKVLKTIADGVTLLVKRVEHIEERIDQHGEAIADLRRKGRGTMGDEDRSAIAADLGRILAKQTEQEQREAVREAEVAKYRETREEREARAAREDAKTQRREKLVAAVVFAVLSIVGGYVGNRVSQQPKEVPHAVP